MTLAALGILCCVVVLQITAIFTSSLQREKFSRLLLIAAGCILLGVTVYRSILIRFIAVTNTWESLVFMAAVISLILGFSGSRAGKKPSPYILFGGSIMAIVLLAVASSPVASSALRPPVPALQSYWLVLHVIFSFIGEAFFCISFISALIWLVSRDQEKRKRLDRTMYAMVAVGYPFFTAGALIFGAIWAEYAWGSFWSWDPKETWALVTWLFYTAYLHFRLIKGFRGRVSAWLLIVGFVLMGFTFFGVNFLLSGLHSYG